MPSVTAAIAIPAAPEEVWAVVSDIANAQRWNKAWGDIELTTEMTEGRGTRFRARAAEDDGEGEASEFEITGWIAPEYIEFTPVRDPNEEPTEIQIDWHAFKLVPADDETTRVELTAQATARGFRGRIAGLFFWSGYQRVGLEEALKSLAEIFGVVPDEDPA